MDEHREIIKAAIGTMFDSVCESIAIDRATLYQLIDELAEDEGFVDTSNETIH